MYNTKAAANDPSLTPSASSPRELLSLIGHELRTPLNSILGFSQLITMDQDASEKVSGWAHAAHGAGLSLNHMIDSLLLFAATDSVGPAGNSDQSAGLILTPTTVHLGELLAGVGSEISSLFDGHGGEVTARVADDVAEVTTSERHLRFALSELVRNAAQYGDTAPIRIAATALNDGVQLTVEDDGPGIPADQYAHCAAPFSRGPGVTGIGLGLGIPLAERIVTRLGGILSYDNPDSGPSTFTIELPPPKPTV